MSLLEMSFSGAVLVIVVALIRKAAGKRLPSGLFPVLWRVALLRLLVPFSLESRFSVYQAVEHDWMTAAMFPEGPAAVPAAQPGVPIWSVIWGVGALLVGGYFLLAWLRWYRKFSTAQPVETELVQSWLAAHKLLRPLAVRQSAAVDSPLSRGLLRPVILLPAEGCGEEALPYVLEHEYVHIRHLDQLTKLAVLAALCIHWFNPLVWLLARLADRDLELACDQAVLRCFGEGARSAYAYTLLAMEEHRGTSASVCSYFSQHPLEERICSIMKTKKVSVLATTCVVVLMLLVTLAVATAAAEPEPAGESGVPVTMLAEVPESWTWPCPGGSVSYTYGEHPNGFCDHICISASKGTDILAALSGTVEAVGFDPDAGNYVVLVHEGGIRTSYQHLLEVTVSAGDAVSGGDRIGAQGATGKVTGPCLSFAVQAEGEAVDPMDYFA